MDGYSGAKLNRLGGGAVAQAELAIDTDQDGLGILCVEQGRGDKKSGQKAERLAPRKVSPSRVEGHGVSAIKGQQGWALWWCLSLDELSCNSDRKKTQRPSNRVTKIVTSW